MPGVGKELDHLVGRRLIEIAIPESDGDEVLWREQGYNVVYVGPEAITDLRGTDRNSCRDRAGLFLTNDRHRGRHGRSGGQTVIDKHDVAIGCLDAVSIASQLPFQPRHISSLDCGDLVERSLIDAEMADYRLVADNDPAMSDCAHRELLMARHSHLPHHDNVEGCFDPLRHLERDWDATAGEAINHRAIEFVAAKGGRQRLAGRMSIGET